MPRVFDALLILLFSQDTRDRKRIRRSHNLPSYPFAAGIKVLFSLFHRTSYISLLTANAGAYGTIQ